MKTKILSILLLFVSFLAGCVDGLDGFEGVLVCGASCEIGIPSIDVEDVHINDAASVPVDTTPSLAVLAGQSNVVGATVGTHALDNIDYPHDMAYAAHIGAAAAQPTWMVYPWAPIGARQSRDGTAYVGPELDMARDLEAREPGRWSMLKFALTSSTLDQWSPDSPYPVGDPDDLFEQLNDRMELAEQETGAKVRFLTWWHGESDSSNQAAAMSYAARMIVWRDRLWIRFPGLLIVIVRLNDSFSGAFGDVTRAGQEYLATQPGFVLVDVDDLPMMSDAVHYPLSSQLQAGRRIVDRYFDSL